MAMMEFQEQPTVEQTVESLAQTVAHLALQLTISQIQLRALGLAIEDAGVVASADVLTRVRELAEVHAGQFLQANMGPDIAAMVDLGELERQISEYLGTA